MDGSISPLVCAVDTGDLAAVKRALFTSASCVDETGEHGDTALMRAAARGSRHILERLLAAGANVNCTDRNGDSALMWAVRSHHFYIADVLLDHEADVNRQNDDEDTPLVLACRANLPHLVDKLVRTGADVGYVDGNGDTPLLVACRGRFKDVAVTLLGRGLHNRHYARDDTIKPKRVDAAIVNRVDGDGFAPLLYAVHYGFVDLMLLLLLSGADIH